MHLFHLCSGLLRAHTRVWCERSAIYERMVEAEKHVPGALCEDLGGVNGQKCTKQLHFPNPYYPLVLQSAPHPQSCRSCVAAALASAQIAGSACESPARKHAHDEPREAQTTPAQRATIADRSIPVPGWMPTCAGRREPPATRNSPHTSPDLPRKPRAKSARRRWRRATPGDPRL